MATVQICNARPTARQLEPHCATICATCDARTRLPRMQRHSPIKLTLTHSCSCRRCHFHFGALCCSYTFVHLAYASPHTIAAPIEAHACMCVFWALNQTNNTNGRTFAILISRLIFIICSPFTAELNIYQSKVFRVFIFNFRFHAGTHPSLHPLACVSQSQFSFLFAIFISQSQRTKWEWFRVTQSSATKQTAEQFERNLRFLCALCVTLGSPSVCATQCFVGRPSRKCARVRKRTQFKLRATRK